VSTVLLAFADVSSIKVILIKKAVGSTFILRFFVRRGEGGICHKWDPSNRTERGGWLEIFALPPPINFQKTGIFWAAQFRKNWCDSCLISCTLIPLSVMARLQKEFCLTWRSELADRKLWSISSRLSASRGFRISLLLKAISQWGNESKYSITRLKPCTSVCCIKLPKPLDIYKRRILHLACLWGSQLNPLHSAEN